MRSILQKTFSASLWFRSCCICRLSMPSLKWFCSGCEKKLNSLYMSPQNMIREQNGVTHIRFFDWDKENDLFIRLLLNSFKKKGAYFIIKKIVSDFLHHIMQIYCIPKNMVVIPAPSTDGQNYDHAFYLASCFSDILDFPLNNILYKDMVFNTQKKQKQKTRSQRTQLRFYLKKNISLDKVIFIDDILTTGSTAQAAYRALNKPKTFVIFTIVWRPPLN